MIELFRCKECRETYELAFKRGDICLCCKKQQKKHLVEAKKAFKSLVKMGG